ncbi:DUF2922 domain-containing protein [Clostridium autoethanogenum]|uniref:DUF2922 domain-containing protein n=1 Tax=Clostridium autoethanogenum DSM 10061 TaxID=1341692 RepID=A0ABN4BGR3_9CLOT|nr:DUF2922 domain-containing protein [Clostridium autoethanogenum]AGY76804.1 DUF2922 domain-containing protein [Clostridium autoethanogenum DSM 10061]ALU36958.1 hypothetical protein CLAU_2530 [Clostridium autoethanogenum DSM 10061]OVY50352.1 hypothetical protein WX72_02424 [Clostridium autoethanogenum]
MSKSLVMSFLNEQGKKTSIKVENVKEGLADLEVKNAMTAIIAKNVFTSKSGDLKSIDAAHILDSSTTELQVK